MTKQELIAAVRAHAEAHYEQDGWDFLVECWSDEDIAEWMCGASTPEVAIRNCRRTTRVLDEARQEQRASFW